ncbi:acyl carrier protein [Streptomyces sp. PTM05]|uniref:Acyl carrier protein n=1 Tax=Streptantibioticus parmotrematis TaxID=2873249 RepID=A0ABS7QUL5_9ACTN|nr:acyl carrier protein [Streptantibioticus parmotrematis]MBY8885479.1 acyl carrier protein [Streptantibioticus parmotrematis]
MSTPTRTRDEIAHTVRTAVADVIGTEPEEIGDDVSLVADYGVDSLELMDIGARLEKALDVHIEVRDLTLAETVGHAVDLLEERLRERS